MEIQKTEDEQLLILITQGNQEAYDILFERYYKIAKGAICNCLQTVTKRGEFESYELFFYELFTKALNTYRFKECPFKMFFNTIINKTLKGKIYEDSTSRKLSNQCISLNSYIDEDTELIELIEDANEMNPSDALTKKEIELVLNSPLSKNKNDMNEIQRNVLKLRTEGYKLKEISEMLHISITSAKRYLSDYDDCVPLSKIKLQFK